MITIWVSLELDSFEIESDPLQPDFDIVSVVVPLAVYVASIVHPFDASLLL